MAVEEIAFNENRFRELVLYVADRCQDDPTFGATKLNKILFYADFLHYGEYGKPLTGATYRKLEHGPAPKQLLPVQESLVREGSAALSHRERYGYVQKRIVALREPNLSSFSGDDIALVDTVIRAFADNNAWETSQISHRELGWKQASLMEDIPYFAVFLSSAPLTEGDIERGQKIAAEHGLSR